MGDNDLLNTLGRAAREGVAAENGTASPDLDDPRWDALSAGTLSREETAALYESAQASEAGRRAWEAFRPFSDRLDHEIVQGLPSMAAEAVVMPAPSHPAFSFDPKVWVPLTAIAAALLLVVGMGVFEPTPKQGPEGPPTTLYTVELEGVSAVRSSQGSDEVTVWQPGSVAVIRLRPKRAAKNGVEVRFFRCKYGTEHWEPWPIHDLADIDPETGAVRVSAILGQDLTLPMGRWRIAMAVGEKGSLPAVGELLSMLVDGSQPDDGSPWQLLLQQVEARKAPPS